MSSMSKKYLDYDGLSNVANKIKERLQKVSTMPTSPTNGDVVLYVGTTTANYTNGYIYMYNSSASSWMAINDEWTPTVAVSNNQVIFDNLSPDYAYDLYAPANVKYTAVQEENSSLYSGKKKVTYTLSGASDGTLCKLRVLK